MGGRGGWSGRDAKWHRPLRPVVTAGSGACAHARYRAADARPPIASLRTHRHDVYALQRRTASTQHAAGVGGDKQRLINTVTPRAAPRTRKTDRVKAVAASADQVPSVETVGVGIVLKPSFQSDTFLALVVHSLVPGSSAEQSRMIQVGPLPARVPGREDKRFVVGRASRRSAEQCEAAGSRIVLSRANGLLPGAAWLCRRIAWGHLYASA